VLLVHRVAAAVDGGGVQRALEAVLLLHGGNFPLIMKESIEVTFFIMEPM